MADDADFDFDSVAAKKAFRDYNKAVAKDKKSQAQKQKTLDEEAAKAAKETRDALVSNLKKALKKSMQAGNLEEANQIDAAIKTIQAEQPLQLKTSGKNVTNSKKTNARFKIPGCG